MRTAVTAVIGATLIAGSAMAAPPDAANYVGTKMCGVCHKAEASGNQLGKWQESPHAKAFATLGTEAAKEAGKKVGVDNPQTSGKCLKCHATAYNFGETLATEKVKVEDGVSCESCHGPGKKYMAKSVMEDRAKCIENGMIYPATKSCKLCHNEESPTFKGFDEKTFAEKIAHPNPKVKH